MIEVIMILYLSEIRSGNKQMYLQNCFMIHPQIKVY